MEITWLGHACFRLRSDDLVVVTDPYPESLGLRPETRPATVVTVSNSHPNHSNRLEVGGSPTVFDTPGEYEYSGIAARGVMTTLLEGQAQRERNVAYSIAMDNVNVCHLGDIVAPLTTRQVEDLQPVDVLLAPAGGGCTLDLERILQLMQDLDPKVVIPMHYQIPGSVEPLGSLDAFLQLMGVSEVQPRRSLTVTTNSLPANMQVTILEPRARPVS
jgi:L-ascorbate metabolism protein UlaG (beta-lactamase superfamily)